MRKYNLDYANIGRLEVATETIMDHSKSIKTVLMQLFHGSGNSEIEGVYRVRTRLSWIIQKALKLY